MDEAQRGKGGGQGTISLDGEVRTGKSSFYFGLGLESILFCFVGFQPPPRALISSRRRRERRARLSSSFDESRKERVELVRSFSFATVLPPPSLDSPLGSPPRHSLLIYSLENSYETRRMLTKRLNSLTHSLTSFWIESDEDDAPAT